MPVREFTGPLDQQTQQPTRRTPREFTGQLDAGKRGAGGDLVEGLYRGLAFPGDIVTPWYNLALPKQYEIGTPTEALKSVGAITDRPRTPAMMIGEYASMGPATVGAAASRGATTAGKFLGPLARETATNAIAALGGYAGARMFPEHPVIGEMAGALAPTGAARLATSAARPYLRSGGQSMTAGPEKMRENIALAKEVDAPISLGMATDAERYKGWEHTVQKTPGGITPFRNFGHQAAASVRSRLSQISGGYSIDRSKAGRAITEGLFGKDEGWISKAHMQKRALYDQADALINPNQRYTANNTIQQLDDMRKLTRGGERAEAALRNDPDFERVMGEFTENWRSNMGALPYATIKKVRTHVDEIMQARGRELVGTQSTHLWKPIREALTRDMEEAARATGGDAVLAMKNAGDYYKFMTSRIDDFYLPLKKRGITPTRMFNAAVGKNPQDKEWLGTAMDGLSQEQQNTVRQVVLSRMGLPPASAQRAVEGSNRFPFAMPSFLTNYAAMENAGTLDVLFGRGPYRRDLNRVARYAEKIAESGSIAFNPKTTTAGVGMASSVLFGALGSTPGAVLGATVGHQMYPGATGALGGAALGAMAIPGKAISGTILTGKLASSLFLNPKFVGWLADSALVPKANLPRHLTRLATIANSAAETDPEFAEAAQQYLEVVGERMELDNGSP